MLLRFSMILFTATRREPRNRFILTHLNDIRIDSVSFLRVHKFKSDNILRIRPEIMFDSCMVPEIDSIFFQIVFVSSADKARVLLVQFSFVRFFSQLSKSVDDKTEYDSHENDDNNSEEENFVGESE